MTWSATMKLLIAASDTQSRRVKLLRKRAIPESAAIGQT